MTTNHPEKLDGALLRPGRIDMNLKFSKTTRKDVADMFELWFGKAIPSEDLEYISPYKYSHAEICKLFFENINQPNNLLQILRDQQQYVEL
jgi:ATP-dependent 26S proteasome regulatory subunit